MRGFCSGGRKLQRFFKLFSGISDVVMVIGGMVMVDGGP
jgi:hypothetical protein